MTLHQISTAVLLASGVVGVVALGLSILAYVRFRHTTYRRMLFPLIAVPLMFTVAHGFVLLWPTHPAVIDLLETLAFTAMIVAVGRLIQLHPRLSDPVEGDNI